MFRINMKQIVMALALTAVMIQGISAEDYIVGGNAGWTNTANINYTQQFVTERVEQNDTLVFNFGTGHNVATVTKAAYDACTTTNPISIITTGPATIRLNTTGFHYFICTVGTHCANGGQKLAVNVLADDDTPPPPPGTPPTSGNNSPPPPPTTGTTTTTTSSPPPPPAGNSASARGLGFSFVLVSLAVAFFSC